MPTRQFLLVGDRPVQLPEGVSLADWALEKNRLQNPRIRALLGCIHLIDGVLESNYAILHCSPERLHDIWSTVKLLVDRLENEVAILLEDPSCVPSLDVARKRASSSLTVIQMQVIDEFHSFGPDLDEQETTRLRKHLCVSIGEINAFLRDAFGGIVANDPRSQREEDYYLSKRFPRDVEEAVWLLRQVEELCITCKQVIAQRDEALTPFLQALVEEPYLPSERHWAGMRSFLEQVLQVLVAKMKSTIALRAIRFDDLETLEDCASRLPEVCHTIEALYTVGLELVDRLHDEASEQPERFQPSLDLGLETCHSVVAARLKRNARSLHRQIDDLNAFMVLWKQAIERRRALFWSLSPDE